MEDSGQDPRIENLEEKVSHLSRMLVKSFNYADDDPDTFLQNARKTTEAICRFIHLKELGEPKKKMMLNDYMRALTSNHVIPDRIGILMGTIQTYGNYGAHAQEDLSESTLEWIAPCQTALASLTNWFFLEYLHGEVPEELVVPISEHGDRAPAKSATTSTSNSNKFKGIIIGAAVVGVLGLIGLFIAKSYVGNEQNVEIKKTSIAASDSTVQQTEDITNKLNETEINADAIRIAVIYFDNSSDDKDLDKLRKGLADMMISDLSKVSMLSVVERDQLEEILKEQNLSNSDQFDPATAAKIGKLLGAQHILMGGFFELMGSLRIDARIIDVETGKIMKSEGVDGPTDSFFDLEKKLVWKILSGLNIDLTEEDNTSLIEAQSQLVSYKASLMFSQGLDLMDQGETTKAIEMLETVLRAYPNFEPAQKALSKLKVAS